MRCCNPCVDAGAPHPPSSPPLTSQPTTGFVKCHFQMLHAKLPSSCRNGAVMQLQQWQLHWTICLFVYPTFHPKVLHAAVLTGTCPAYPWLPPPACGSHTIAIPAQLLSFKPKMGLQFLAPCSCPAPPPSLHP